MTDGFSIVLELFEDKSEPFDIEISQPDSNIGIIINIDRNSVIKCLNFLIMSPSYFLKNFLFFPKLSVIVKSLSVINTLTAKNIQIIKNTT